MRIILAIATFSLAACGQQESPPPEANENVPAPAVEAAATPELAGEWVVAALDGKPVAQGSAMSASFAGERGNISQGCIRRAFTYTQKRNVVSFAPDPGGSANCEGQGASAQLATAADAAQQASIVIFSKDGNEANLSGTGGNLTLRRR